MVGIGIVGIDLQRVMIAVHQCGEVRLRNPEFKVADCSSAETVIPVERAGSVAFSQDGETEGNLPCGGAREETTFGRVKSTYNNR